jgi:hypothetical protein
LKLVLGCGCDKVAADVAAIRLQLAAALVLLQALQIKEIAMAGSIATLTADVAANTSVVSSALVLINGFAAQLSAAGTDPVKLQALQDQLESSDTALAAAVAANTGAPPPPPAAPPTA